jgi:hypothetical protein
MQGSIAIFLRSLHICVVRQEQINYSLCPRGFERPSEVAWCRILCGAFGSALYFRSNSTAASLP